MSDPLQESPQITSLKFNKLHSPKMKSVYWRHFGFPMGDDDCIITKQNVVCTLCHKVLTNHGNTTNLRAHLQYRHKEVFDMLVQENNIAVPPRKPPAPKMITKIKREPKRPKIKMEYSPPTLHNTISNESAGNDEHDEQSILYESVVPMTYDDDDVIDSNHFTKIEVSNANDIKTSPCSTDLLTVNRTERKFCITTSANNIENELAIDDYQMLEALANLVVNDIRNVDTLYDDGMAKFIRTICGNITIPALKKIETYIKEVHSDKQTSLADQIKVHSQIKPFSLGFEIWENVEQKHFLSIYFNYATDAPDFNLITQIYCTIEYNKFTVIDNIFEDFNLNNCTAAIINCDYDEYLKHFLNEKNIPVILSYDTVVNHCIKNVIAIPAVASIIEEVKDTLMRYHLEISAKDVEIPQISNEFPWTYYELLKFFSETVSWPEDVEALVTSSKVIYDILGNLAITIETLKGEDIPLSSMLSPITSKVLTKKLVITEGDDNFAATIKDTISTTLDKMVLSDIHLTISALLDPRFHRLTNITNYNTCVQILTDKYDRIVESQGISPIKPSGRTSNTGVKSSTSSMIKKSNLELFFDLTEGPIEQPAAQEPSNVETDLKRYRSDVYVSLDESPFVWWSKMSHLYSSLKHLAVQYQCLPCVVNMNYKKPIKQQISEHQKRFMLTGNLIDAILFLHYN